MVNPRRLGSVESWARSGPDLDSPGSSWRGGLCEKTGPSLYGVTGLSRRNISKRKEKRDTQGQFGEFSCSSSSSLLSTWPPSTPVGMWGTPSPHPSHRRVCEPGRAPGPTSEAPGRVHTTKGPMCARRPEESECLNLPDQRLLES